ncbi:hypothetical protein BDV41DRAFT_139638 [Aspergillus transmontanensis]|uniref:Uncharacterized protein n=1 Tax=Aspergillus transmontanensis TaxID=1034304 RepID=A0A5N6VDV3_9EURO|nr:hypothetical protein BDV41DRAFT_139638 [Aspergillus transmontanensis]
MESQRNLRDTESVSVRCARILSSGGSCVKLSLESDAQVMGQIPQLETHKNFELEDRCLSRRTALLRVEGRDILPSKVRTKDCALSCRPDAVASALVASPPQEAADTYVAFRLCAKEVYHALLKEKPDEETAVRRAHSRGKRPCCRRTIRHQDAG